MSHSTFEKKYNGETGKRQEKNWQLIHENLQSVAQTESSNYKKLG